MAGIPLPTSVSTSCHILSIHHLPLDLYKHTLFLFLFLHFDNAFAVPANIYFPLPCHYHSSCPSCAISPSLLFLLPCRHPRLPPHTPSESGTLLLAWMTCTVETAFPAQFSSPSFDHLAPPFRFAPHYLLPLLSPALSGHLPSPGCSDPLRSAISVFAFKRCYCILSRGLLGNYCHSADCDL